MRDKMQDSIPLKVLICDAESSAAESLRRALEDAPNVLGVKRVENVDEGLSEARSGDYNTIFVDPGSLDLDKASSFIFEIRKTLPEIVFVLYLDRARAERSRALFYKGERQRFAHYYSLDKQTPVSAFADELAATLKRCQSDLSWRMSATSIERLRSEAAKLAKRSAPENTALLKAVEENLSRLSRQPSVQDVSASRSVFLSHRFAEEEYVKGLVRLLEESGFTIITGKSSNTYVSRSVIDRIRQARFFVCLMTRADAKADGTFTTSPWLLEEKGVALTLEKPLVLMIEEGVSDFGGLQGDWQRIHFGSKGFLTAALEAVAQLRSYVGAGEVAAQQSAAGDAAKRRA
jgi:hypothetical protein